MACLHPDEERLGVYEGGARRVAGRRFCALCGEILYEPPAPAPPAGGDRAGARPPALRPEVPSR